MTSFRDDQNLIILSHGSNLVEAKECLILYDLFESRNPNFPHEAYTKFDSLVEFRFRKREILSLAEVLEIPETIRCNQWSICGGIVGLCMLPRRLSYPCRYGDMIQRFAKPVPVFSMVTNILIDHIYAIHGRRLTQWNLDTLSPSHLEMYVAAITSRGSPLENCFGFIDGTVRPIARPAENQRVVYNGHKCVNTLKFQSIVLPNGLITLQRLLTHIFRCCLVIFNYFSIISVITLPFLFRCFLLF